MRKIRASVIITSMQFYSMRKKRDREAAERIIIDILIGSFQELIWVLHSQQLSPNSFDPRGRATEVITIFTRCVCTSVRPSVPTLKVTENKTTFK